MASPLQSIAFLVVVTGGEGSRGEEGKENKVQEHFIIKKKDLEEVEEDEDNA